MAWSYYIYYRVASDKTEDCALATRKLLSTLHHKTGVRGRVLKKRNEPLLWMEIYEQVTNEEKFEWELAEAVAASGITATLQAGSARHMECFGS